MNTKYSFAFIFLFVLFFSCKRKHENPPEKLVVEKESVNSQVENLLRDQLEQFQRDSLLTIGTDTIQTAFWINQFYLRRRYIPAWSHDEKLLAPADTLIAFIDSAECYGLIPADYHQEKLKKKIRLIIDSASNKINATRLYEINILLTDAFYKLLVHLGKGRLNANSHQPEWKGANLGATMVNSAFQAIGTNNVRAMLESFEPITAQYSLMKKYYNELRIRNKTMGWDSVSLTETDTSVFMEMLPQRLLCSGDYDTTLHTRNDSVRFARAIKSFQKKHGLIADGKAGKNTIQLLAVSSDDELHQLEMTLERLRWENPFTEDYYVRVNIPAYTATLYGCDTILFVSKVITGKPDTQSPFRLDSKITHFYIYPYWTVPFSICVKEILPILQRDTSYLSKHNMDVLDYSNRVVDIQKVKWSKYSEKYFPFKIRQRDGDENTLGVLKFMFSNKFGIYLHDTNSRYLFGKENRALSHGCIRLEKAKNLADFIVSNLTLNFTPDSLNSHLSSKERIKVDLFQRLPIHIRYFTCEADSNGFTIYNDIYQLDREMVKQLYHTVEGSSDLPGEKLSDQEYSNEVNNKDASKAKQH